MRVVRSLLVVVVAACGSAPPTPAAAPSPSATPAPAPSAPSASIAETPPAVVAAPEPPPAPPPRAVTVAIDNVLTDGPEPQTAALARLERGRDALAACGHQLDASVAVEISFSLLVGGAIPHVRTFGSVPEPLVACIRSAVGSTEAEAETEHEPTDVYALVVFQLEGLAEPSRPKPPDLREDGEAMCSMFTRSGAMNAPIEQRQKLAQAWFRDNIRHPVVTHHPWHIAMAHPADVSRVLKSIKKKSKAKVCADPGW